MLGVVAHVLLVRPDTGRNSKTSFVASRRNRISFTATAFAFSCGLFSFYFFTARRHASAVYAMVMCLSVCLSQVGVLLKRLKVGSRKQFHTIAHGL